MLESPKISSGMWTSDDLLEHDHVEMLQRKASEVETVELRLRVWVVKPECDPSPHEEGSST